jgi:hypothetical protein
MNERETQVLFPPAVIPELGDLRGAEWQALVAQAAHKPPLDREVLGFVLMMVRLGGCTACRADSYWAMRGCLPCARNTVGRFRGSDQDLRNKFAAACQEIDSYLSEHGG